MLRSLTSSSSAPSTPSVSDGASASTGVATATRPARAGGSSAPKPQAPGSAGRQRADVSRSSSFEEELSPGQAGPSATVELDPSKIGKVRFAYAPDRDGDPDPGEIVWTWVPYEERDGRGKDRPVVIVAAGERGQFLAVQLTSKAHDRDRDHVSLGSGDWDPEGRPSWVALDRVFRVSSGGMRREGAILDEERFERVTAALSSRYGWR
ncbi:type II toxin-antitoxin system PemK/MazF family toxin [Agromyces protaetiae]|uniref:Type II toxin-antitoxin system PemK/MazF family toxin n=1 Tax=Agromyces protaetiae TaxID=2509455 RepID=A0A4P6FGB3_9MICO|nr:type II toxin-antitoxin system PemK/MazF family toxin [Agromyces protaetiae]